MGCFVHVLINKKGIDNCLFTYSVPDNLENDCQVGKRVHVQFNKKIYPAYIIENMDINDIPIEKIIDICDIDNKIILDNGVIALLHWMAANFHCSLGDALRCVIPAYIEKRLDEKKKVILTACQLKSDKFLECHLLRASLSKEILTYIKELPACAVNISEIENIFSYVDSGKVRNAIKKLSEKGYLDLIYTENNACNIEAPRYIYPEHQELTDSQTTAIDLINDQKNKKVILIHGVTGSGKTEVYLNLIDNCLKNGKNAIFLIPEISLSPQTLERVWGRFGNIVAVFHSGLSENQKYCEWKKINDGQAKIVVGTRSAVFVPLNNIGLIIVDEEHDSSYRQEKNPFYRVHQIAAFRTSRANAKLILGSATPSVETYYRASHSQIELIEMKNRIDGALMPHISIVDMREELRNGNSLVLSDALKAGIKKRLENKEQIILFINRRGYSSFIMCRSCGHVIKCPHCDVSLTYHSSENILICHYCGKKQELKKTCPICNSELKGMGAGTEKVGEEVLSFFPDANIIRLDTDMVSQKNSYGKILNSFRNREADILIGTQMVSKGHDFPLVTLVGIIEADSLLNFPDFRSEEKAFQLFMQTAGRSGRGMTAGEVIIQTYQPENSCLQAVICGNYEIMYQKQMKMRKQFFYPPYSNIIRILISGKDEQLVKESAVLLTKNVKLKLNSVTSKAAFVQGPASAPIKRIRDLYRWQFFIKVRYDYSLEKVLAMVEYFYINNCLNNKIKMVWDINPDSYM